MIWKERSQLWRKISTLNYIIKFLKKMKES